MNNLLYEQTLDFTSTLKDNSAISEQKYHKTLEVLCDSILYEDPNKITTILENTKKLRKYCNSCGTQLETWEDEICGPCKVDDHRFTDNISDDILKKLSMRGILCEN